MNRLQQLLCEVGLHSWGLTPYPLWFQCQVCGTVRGVRG